MPTDNDDAVNFSERMHLLGGWRADTMTRARQAILAADPGVTEAVKWRKPTNPDGVLEWSHGGGLCTGEVYRDKVKLTFHHGAKLEDPANLFNASLEGATRRAIDFLEGDDVDADALGGLIRAAAAFNAAKPKRR